MTIRFCVLAAVLFLGLSAYAQAPVSWSYSAKHLSGQVLELHMVAHIQDGWHIYSIKQPAEAVAIPTSIKYITSPIFEIDGPIKEVGSLIHYKNDIVGIAQDQYTEKVDFVQIIKLKANVKSQVSGTITFQACTDEQCLPPMTINFSIPVFGEGTN